MKVKINCPKCKGVLIVPGDAAGRKARCAFCKNKFVIPSFEKKIDDMATQWLSMDALEREDDFLSEGPAQLQYDKPSEPEPGAIGAASASGTPAAALSSGMHQEDLDDLNLEEIERELDSGQTGAIGTGLGSGFSPSARPAPAARPSGTPAGSAKTPSPVPTPATPATPASVRNPVSPPPPAKPVAPAPKKPVSAPPAQPAVRPAASAQPRAGEMRLQDLVGDLPPRPVPPRKSPSGEVELKVDRTGQVKIVGQSPATPVTPATPKPPVPSVPIASADDDVIEFNDEDTAIEVIQIDTPGVVDPAARSTVNLVPAPAARSDLEQMMEDAGADLEIEIDTNDSSSLGFDPVQVATETPSAARVPAQPPAVAPTIPANPPAPAPPVDPGRIPWGQVRLAIVEQNSSRVVFGFDPALLRSEGFRASMPMMCLGCQNATPGELLARPILWVDRTVRRKEEDEDRILQDLLSRVSGFQVEVGRNRTATTVREVLHLLHDVPETRDPFNLPMPYFVCRACAAEQVLYAAILPSDKGPWCRVQITSPPIALAWLGRVHGVTGDEYADLEKRTLFMTEVWRTIPARVRRNLSGWFDFEPGEELIGYLPDADFQQKELGLAGIVVTDRRLSWHKYGRRGDLPVATPATLQAGREGAFVEIGQQTGGKLQKMVKLRPDDAAQLRLMLEEIDSAIQIGGL